jgi:hypothetical protein
MLAVDPRMPPLVKRPPVKKKLISRKTRLTVDPTRLALAAMERIRTVLARKGHIGKFGPPATMRDLAARASYLGLALPSSYSAAMRVSGSIGEPEALLTAAEMKRAFDDAIGARTSRPDHERYAPFARVGDKTFACFDREALAEDGELPVIEWSQGGVRPSARHFGEWIDAVADSREEQVAQAADIPEGLRDLLLELGFNFDDPIVGRLETGDTEALEELLGPERTREVRGEVDRLFDSSGKASLTLNLDEFTLATALRTGIFVFEPEDVFRWLRHFRDENFFGDSKRAPSHPDHVRDLRRAPREPQLILHGILEVMALPAKRHTFRAAGGRSADDFYLLGRTSSTRERSPSLLLHVVGGEVRGAHSLDEPLTDIYVSPEGIIWALSHSGTAIRFTGNDEASSSSSAPRRAQHQTARAFPLHRGSRGRTWWYGIGGAGDRVLVWGAGALLMFDGEKFVPFEPDAGLEEHESVVALCASRKEIAMLVTGDHVGAVARFDGKKWIAITEDQVIEAQLADLDVWRGVSIVLARSGELYRAEGGGKPRPVIWDDKQPAFVGENGQPRPAHEVMGFDGGALIASDGGVVSVGAGDPIFHAAASTPHEPARLARVGSERAWQGGGAGGATSEAARGRAASRASDPGDTTPGIVAMCGPHAWVWRRDSFYVLDLREW